MKKNIPNALTLLNLFCGCIAVIYAVNDQFSHAALFVFLGVFFDFFDGFAARKLEVSSALGLQLDSLADMVTSGVVPGLVMYKMLDLSTEEPLLNRFFREWDSGLKVSEFELSALPLIGLCITLASAYRLAKFNLDDEQKTYFKGLPTPANTLLIISFPLIIEYQDSEFIENIILNTGFLIGMTALSCYLLNSNIKLFALKLKDFSYEANVSLYRFLILCVILLIVLQFAAIPIIILLYILLSYFNKLTIN
ncbi:CDP-alcohol phosphatidyltransferase family protein [Aestuariibaculum sediminum]|uniref:CDP-alcohol phosphatidyltransferase family protein n=1 Tax=Aestuariibaculum sediminum TaxID=2770637 RepID=A0A8J6QA63_9FLAO|nr:CDP-alcohol phosphatidyltransferase family protein [Aestuariibaculum sediminum]MBD0833112.1 CDP-alcohol phosphatidyltransferase family protein [Aestuariibaculum sediminum]